VTSAIRKFAIARPSVRNAALAFIVLGVALRLAQYLHNESLRLDESFLALNLQSRGLGDLFGQLDYNQAAPPGYLFLEGLRGAQGCLDRIFGIQSEVSVQPMYEGMPSYLESLSTLQDLGFELTGVLPCSWTDICG